MDIHPSDASEVQSHTKHASTTKFVKPCLLVGFSSCRDVTGLALAFDLLLSEFDARQLPYQLVDFGVLGHASKAGSFNVRRVWETLSLLLRFYSYLWATSTTYILISSSRFGFIRDALMMWGSYLCGHRVVLHLNGGGYKSFYATQLQWFQRIIVKTLAQADCIIVLGEHLRDQFSFVPNIEQKLRIVPNGLPLNLETDIVIPKSLPRKEPHNEPLRLLYLSNLIESKGYLALLSACRILYHDYKIPIQCDFCGVFIEITTEQPQNADAESYFFSRINEWSLTDIVTYHGRVTGERKQQLLQHTHLFILPTIYPWEGQPISIIEALAYSTPIISTPHRGIPEQVIDGYNGLLTTLDPQTMPEEIAEAVRTLWENSVHYEKFSKNARKHFEANFTQKQYLDALIPLIISDISF